MTVQIRTAEDVKRLGTILGVWAHPDDETWCAAGLMAAALENGQRVICVLATKGEAGVQDEARWPAEKLGDIRAREFAAGAKVLGLDDYHWLNCRDGGCSQLSDEAGAAMVRAFIETHLPDTILTFGPDGITGHPDHQAVSRWVDQAVADSPIQVYHVVQEADVYEKCMKQLDKQFNFYFNIDKPPLRRVEDSDIGFRLSDELCQKKCAALKAMPSQTEAMFKSAPDGFMLTALGCECYMKVK